MAARLSRRGLTAFCSRQAVRNQPAQPWGPAGVDADHSKRGQTHDGKAPRRMPASRIQPGLSGATPPGRGQRGVYRHQPRTRGNGANAVLP